MSRKHTLRRVTLGAETYGWVVHDSGGHLTVSIWREPRAGLRLRVHFPGRTVITPAVIRNVVEAAALKQLKPGMGKHREVYVHSPALGFPDPTSD